MSKWTADKVGRTFPAVPAWLVVAALNAGGAAAVEWAGYRASRSPYPFAYWLSQAEGRAHLADAYTLDRAKDAELDAWIERLAEREGIPVSGGKRKGKKS